MYLMNKKVILLILIGILILVTGGFIFWRHYHPQKSSQIKTTTTSTPEPTTINYPKPESYNVPILMYHYIRNAENESALGKNLSVSPASFSDQLKWLKENNYESIKVSDLTDPELKAISKIIFEKKKPIILTFDDGYEDAYITALPIMQKYEFTGTFYIIRNSVGKAEYMNQTQIDKMAEVGMEIGSHTLSHIDLSTADTTDQRKQIFESKLNASTFCYPSGKFNDTTVSLVKEIGYTTATTTKSGIANQDSNLFELPRIRMQDFSGIALGKKLE